MRAISGNWFYAPWFMIDDTKCRFGVKRCESNPIVLTPFGMCRHVLPVLYPLGSVTGFPSLSAKFWCAFLSNYNETRHTMQYLNALFFSNRILNNTKIFLKPFKLETKRVYWYLSKNCLEHEHIFLQQILVFKLFVFIIILVK